MVAQPINVKVCMSWQVLDGETFHIHINKQKTCAPQDIIMYVCFL